LRKFEFKLEAVLKHREACEEQAAIEQARALEKYRQHHDRLCAAREKLAQVQNVESTDLFDMLNKLNYCNHMVGEVKKKESILENSLNKLETCRENLVKAMQERFVMEKLKEKQLRSYNQVVSMFEQKENDDMATRQFIRLNLNDIPKGGD